MSFTPDDVAILWTLEPTQQDLRNLEISQIRKIMVTYQLASKRPDLLRDLQARGKQLVIRMTDDDCSTPGRADEAVSAFKGWIDNGLPIVGAIAGVEPEHPFRFEYDTPQMPVISWGQDQAIEHSRRMSYVLSAWRLRGIRAPLVAPGWSQRSISPDEPPVPGLSAWAELTRWVYRSFDGHGVHMYAWQWKPVLTRWWNGQNVLVNIEKQDMKWSLKTAALLKHQPLWIDEIGVLQAGSQAERMDAYVEFAEWLLSAEQQRRGYLGTRVAFYCPFVSNGDPYQRNERGEILRDLAGRPLTHWPPEYLLTEEESYHRLQAALRRWRGQ